MTAWASPRRSGASTPPSPRPRWPSTAPASWPSSRPRRRRRARSSTPWSARASFSGESWLEAAGAVHAENEVLRFLAGLAGLPPSAGGCFVSGGSAGNLERAGRGPRDRWSDRGGGEAGWRWPTPRTRPWPTRWPCWGCARSWCRRPPTVSSPGPRCAAALAGHPPRRVRGRRVGGLHQRRPHRRPGRPGRGVRRAQEPGCTSTAPTAWPRCSPRRFGRRFAGIEAADSLIVDPHKWLFGPLDCCALLYRDPDAARAVHTQDAPYLDALHVDGAWNPADLAFHLTRQDPRAAGVVLARRPRRGGLPPGGGGGAGPRPLDRRSRPFARAHRWSW